MTQDQDEEQGLGTWNAGWWTVRDVVTGNVLSWIVVVFVSGELGRFSLGETCKTFLSARVPIKTLMNGLPLRTSRSRPFAR